MTNRKINKKRKFPKHIVKTLSIHNKESILKTAWENKPHKLHIKENP